MTTVTCTRCDGMAFTLDRCHCRDGDGAFLVEDRTPDGEPWADCEVCRGDGTVARPCRDCDQHGRRRAQLVLTVANLDTGTIASANVVPGAVEPSPAPGGGWRLALGPLLADLAERTGAAPATLREVAAPERPADPDGELSLYLPREWAPDLPAAERHALEAVALARRSYAPWLVYLGRGTAPDPTDHDRMLDRLRRLADRLCLDLVVEVRRRDRFGGVSWDIRYEVPGAPVPAHPHGYHDDLPTAVAFTTVADAMYGLAERSLTAPAHFLDPALPDPDPVPREPADVDQLERRILRDCADASGAQAIWREGRWRHTGLRPGGLVETLTELDTGQVTRRKTVAYLRNWEPPPPSWLAEEIPHSRCPDCRGTGIRAWHLPCFTCQGSRRIRHGAVLTVTDLRGRVVHLNWRRDDGAAPATLVATQSAGQPVLHLAGRFRVRSWAAIFGVRPEDLTDPDGGHVIGQDLLEGTVTLSHPDTGPVDQYLAAASRGGPVAG